MEGELPKEMEVMEVAPEESHECPYCEMTFKGFRSLKTHIGHHFRKGDVRRKLGTGGNVIAKRKKAAKWGSSNQKVSCDICGTVCSNRHSLLRHHMTHTGQKPYKCEACGRGFSANWNLKMHKCTGRPNEADAFTCVDCGKEFTDETMFNDHACGEQHLYETQKTGTPSPSASTSYETPKEEPKGEQLTWDCQFCDRKFMSAKGLGGHMSIHRPQIDTSQSTASVSNTTSEPVKLETTEVQGLFECQFCHRLFNCARGLARHVSVHRIQVGTSENTLPTSSSQITKVEDTGGRSTWDCEFCDRIFTSAKGLGGHMSLHRAQIDTAKSTISSPSHVNQVDGLVQTKWECHMCEKVFTSRKGLCGHMGAHRHRTGTPEHASSSPLLANHTTTSPLLSNCATSLTSLASHEMIIKEESKQTSWECSICQRVFSTPNALGGHMRAHRSASNMLDNVLSPIIRPTLTHHISGDELASTEWECQFCAQLFLDSKSLNEHLYQVHNYQSDTVSPATITATDSSATGAATDSSAYQSPHKCLVCHREFSTPMALGGHMSVHKLKMTPKQKSPKQPAKPKPESPHKSGKPEVPCTVCAKVYQYKASLKRHMSSHAGELGPFKCPHCEETCLLMEDLLVHMDMHQHTKCEICLMTFDQPSLFEQHMKYRHKDLELSSPSKQLPLPETSQVDSSTHILESDSGNAETTLTPKPTAELSAVSPSVNKNAVDWNLRAALSSPPMFSPENATTETVGEQSDGALNLSLRPLQKSESDSVEMQEVSPKLEYDHKEPPKDGKNSLQCQICHQFYPAGLSSIRHKAWHTRRGDKVELGRTNLCKSEKSATPVTKNLENSFRVAIPAHSRENTAIVNTHGVNAPIRVHVKLYPCPVCNKKYTMMQNMQRHLKHAHRKQGVALEKNSTPVKVGDDPPQIMLESISKQEHLPEERKTISLNDEDDGDSVPTWKRYKRGIFKCPICKRAFTWYHNMRTHMKNIHHSTWVTASKSSVKLGQKKQAKCPPPTHKIVDGKKRIICGICNREFVNSSGFGMHMRVHRLKAAKGTSLSLANNVKPESPQVETMQYQSDMKYQPGMQDQPEIPKKRTDSPGPDWENIQFQSEIEYQPGVDYKPEAPKKQTDISRPDQETMPYQSDMEYDAGVRYKPEVPEKQTDSPRPDPEPMHYQSDLEHRPGFQHKTEVLKKQTDSPRPEREPLQHQSDMEYHSGVQYTTEIRKKQTDSPGPDRYFCTTCNQGFFYYCRLKRHIVQQHNSVGIYSKPIKASPPAKIKVKHVTKFFYCHFCPRYFLNTGTLRNHEKWKHPDTGSNSMHLVPILPKPHAETEVHSDPYNVVVKLDPSVTPTADDTLTDTQPGDPTSCSSGFMCQICKKTFSNEDNLMRHIKLHPAHKWLGTTTSTLRKQYKNVATHNISTVYQDGLVACGECGKVFNHTSMLERHKRCHTGEKPFKCPVCASCFTASWSRLVHVKKTHPTYQTANLKRVDKPVVSRHPHPTYPVAKSKTAEDPVLPTGGKSKYWIKDIGGRKVFCCPGCSRSFNNYHALNGHKRHCDYFKKDRLHNINENTNNGPPTPTIIETLQGLIGSDYSDVYDGPFSENQDRPSATNIYKDMNGIEDSYMYNTYSRPNQYIYGDSNGFGTMNIKEEPQDDYPDYCTTSNYVGNGGDSMHDYAEGDNTVHGFGGSKVVDDAIGSMQALSNAIDKFAQSRVLSDSDSEFDDTAPLLIDTEEQPSASYHHSKSYGPTTGHDPHHGSPNTSYQSKDPSPCYDESHPGPSTNYNLLFADAAPLLSDTEEQPSTSYPHTDSYGPTTGHDPDHGSPSTSYQSKDPSICYDESHPRPSTSYNLDDTAPSTSVAGKAEVPHTKEGSLVFKLLSRKNLNDANQNKALMVIKQSVINDRLHGESGFVLGSIHTPMIDMGSDGEVLGYLIGHPTGFGPFCCPVCHRRFPTPSVFANHLMFHVDKCPDVNILANVFRPANDPLHHDDCNCHLFGLTFTSCPKCVEGYTDLDDLKRHVKLHVEQFLECQAAELNL